jgi:lysophospholipase L1-like esterase
MCTDICGAIAQKDVNRFRIVFVGDENLQAEHPGLKREQTFPHLVAADLPRYHTNADVISLAYPGLTTFMILSKTDEIMNVKPDIIVLTVGAKDAYVEPGMAKENVSDEDFKRNLSNIISGFRDRKVRVILMTPPPLWDEKLMEREPYRTYGLDPYLRAKVAATRMIADNEQVPLVDHFSHWVEKLSLGCDVSAWMSEGDLVQPEGHRQLSATLFPTLLREISVLPRQVILVKEGKPFHVHFPGKPPETGEGYLRISDSFMDLFADVIPLEGDLRVEARLRITDFIHTDPVFKIGFTEFGFNGDGGMLYLKGGAAGNDVLNLGKRDAVVDAEHWFTFTISRADNILSFAINGKVLHSCRYGERFWDKMGFMPHGAEMEISDFFAFGNLIEVPIRHKSIEVPQLDIAAETLRQVVIDREEGQYLGHPTTVLTADGNTIYIVYPKGHGKGAVVMKKSTDGGKTWGGRLPVPENWATSQEVPTLFDLTGRDGKRRLVMFSGLYPARMALSEDEGVTWGELKQVFNFGGMVVMSDVVRLKNGDYLAFFHDDGKYFKDNGKKGNCFTVYQTRSPDGGLSWSDPEVSLVHPPAQLCEAGAIRSPDGKQLAILLRENSRTYNSMISFSNDEGQSWSEPVEMPASLTGDRHQLCYAPDGRLVIAFRDASAISPSQGDFVAWVGTYNDLVRGDPGQYRIRLLDNKVEWDCGYPALEVLPDGTILLITYGHWDERETPYIKGVRIRLDEMDELAASLKP